MRRTHTAALIILSWAALAAGQDDPCAVRWAGRAYPLGTFARHVVLGDVDHDGRRDVVGVSYWGKDLIVMRRAVRGFADPVLTPMQLGTPGAVTLGDVTGDGNLDLLTSDVSAPTTFVLAGDGQGGFFAPKASPTAAATSPAALADVDLDGDLDAVVRHGQWVGMHVLKNDGTGSFTVSPTLLLSAVHSPPRAADLDADGDPDLVAAQGAMKPVLRFRNDGSGGFSSTEIDGTSFAIHVELEDLDTDGLPDLLACGPSGPGFTTLQNLGPAGFGTPQSVSTIDLPYSISLDDVDADGDLDAFVSSPGAYEFAVHRREGSGFLPPSLVGLVSGGGATLAADDVLGDATPDILAVGKQRQHVAVLEGKGDGGWYGQEFFELPSPVDEVEALEAADVDADGIPDLVAVSSSDLIVALGAGGTSYTPHFAASTGLSDPVGVEAGDLDGDGALDLVVMQCDIGESWRGSGTGSFGAPQPLPLAGQVTTFALSDTDLDGDLDVICSGPAGASILQGDGAGGFTPPLLVPGTKYMEDSAVIDVDQDGTPDLAGVWYLPSTIGVIVSPGVAVNTTVLQFPWPSILESVGAGDVTGDGAPDVVACNPVEPRVVLLASSAGVGGPGFAAPTTVDFDTPSYLVDVVVRDVDGDGWSDIVVSNLEGRLMVVPSDGIGGFRDQVDTECLLIDSLVIEDLDGDGRLDALSGSTYGSVVAVHRGRSVDWYASVGAGCPGQGGFAPSLSVPTCHDPTVQLGVAIEQAPGGAAALLLIGLGPSSTTIGPSSCELLVAPVVAALPVPLGGAGPGQGAAVLTFAVPPFALGLSFVLQAAVLDPTALPGFTTTNALAFQLP